ncbi:MAG: 4a-hydroxytetrahydrobiopterin dehydratase [Polyangiaceae bacterium]
MSRPTKLEGLVVNAWLAQHAPWVRASDISISRKFEFPDFSAALGFVVRIGLVAEKKDHHPDIELSWGKVRVTWSTHDANGVTKLDLELADESDKIFATMSSAATGA